MSNPLFDNETLGSSACTVLIFSDEKYKALPLESLDLFLELFEQIPILLTSALLDAPLTAKTFLKAKVLIGRYMIDSGWYVRLVRSSPWHIGGCIPSKVEQAIKHNIPIIEGSIAQFERSLGHVEAFVTKSTEEQFNRRFFNNPKMSHFAHNTLAQWNQGGMTLRDLLLEEPARLLIIN